MVYDTDGSSKNQRLPGRGVGELLSNEGSLRYGGNGATSVTPTNNPGAIAKDRSLFLVYRRGKIISVLVELK